MNKRGNNGTFGLIIGLIIALIIIGLIYYLIVFKGLNPFEKVNSCGGTILSKCMTADKCISGGLGFVMKEKNEDCPANQVCCVISHNQVNKQDFGTPSSGNKHSTSSNQNNIGVQSGPVTFKVKVDGEMINIDNKELEVETKYEFNVKAEGEYLNLCRVRILYDNETRPPNQQRTIFVTDLFNCTKGKSFNFTPSSESLTYEPIELDFVAFAQDYNGNPILGDSQGTNSFKFYLQLKENIQQQGNPG